MRPLRLAWVAALLLGLVYMHGVNTESVMAHAAPGTAVPMDSAEQDESDECTAEAGSADADHHDDHHESSHPAQECAVGQPQHGPGLAAPSPATTEWGRAFLAQPLPGAFLAGAESAEPDASRASTETTVLRI